MQARSRRITSSRYRAFRQIGLTLATALYAFWILFPLLFTLASSVMTSQEIGVIPPHWIPQDPTLGNYRDVLIGQSGQGGGQGSTTEGARLVPALANSALIGVVMVVFNLLVGGLAGYAYSRYEFVGRRSGYIFLLATRVVPAIALVTPFFVLFQRTGLLGSPLALMVTYNILTLPLCIWLLKSYFDKLPLEIEEAARVDGASLWQTIIFVVAPLSKPGLAAAGIIIFLESWSEFFFALILTNSLTAPPVLAGYNTMQQFGWPTLAGRAS